MKDTVIYIAYVVSRSQLLRYAFEYPLNVEWGEPDMQKKLKDYFESKHYSHAYPVAIEQADILDFLPYEKR